MRLKCPDSEMRRRDVSQRREGSGELESGCIAWEEDELRESEEIWIDDTFIQCGWRCWCVEEGMRGEDAEGTSRDV